MNLNRNKLYTTLFIACGAGFIWLFYNFYISDIASKSLTACLIKRITSVPCPSCGSTRSINYILQGNFIEALKINPLGYIIAFVMIVSPIWICIDFLFKKETLFKFYLGVEKYIKRPQYAIPLSVLIIFNWIWNISKGL